MITLDGTLAEYRKLFAINLPSANKVQIFREAAFMVARRIGEDGIAKPDVVDRLLALATAYAFFGISEREIESIIGDEIKHADDEREDRVDMERLYRQADEKAARERGERTKANGHAQSDAPVFDLWAPFIVPPFPLDVLPEAARNFVTAQSEAIGCDPAAVAMAVLATFSGAIDHRTELRMMRNTTWWAHPRLWVLLVGNPSQRKSPLITEATRPLVALDYRLQQNYQRQLRE